MIGRDRRVKTEQHKHMVEYLRIAAIIQKGETNTIVNRRKRRKTDFITSSQNTLNEPGK